MATVLVVDDDAEIRQMLRTALDGHGFSVREARTIAEAERAISVRLPAAVLLDLGLPDGDGLELLKRVRRWTMLPILILSSRTRERDKVRGLNAGADDYITKPFGMPELLARMRAALRHSTQERRLAERPMIQLGPIRIDRARGTVTRGGEPVHLTPTELALLMLLARDPGRLVSYEQMLGELHGGRHRSDHHQLRVHVAALRRKLESQPARPEWLVTEPGLGYRLRDSERSDRE